ncbi:Sensor protein QseC [Paraburkholderia domus]|jgi:Signal transduction histidine kinase|uniref:histidine kinase n=1 Tax=Paraburkholderia domus TaxID=2793075 RepID=A0A9N8N3L2_9BURK|nr:ATP-binding protein [Paraburkholderia domus]MBK5091324.1 two-component sensor histidine kinase [Burkholderia sp. R-69927]MBK5125590.1 two-component sensor histidine kinase [Burkholderia sp. R-69980]MBK5168484.1 two-component sensor histidine kinase [Burkholderia sp. R-70211]MBK5183699.1 two-component sensor histidine kinase [Burkholderia sp. R-69749]MCI0149207.1 two-component sensor histidine kinase [Paraburkholderia sediminicola]
MTSIRRWLLGWLIFGLAAASGVAAFGIFHTAREEASELFDYELHTVALSLPSNLSGAGDGEHRNPDLGDLADDRVVIEIWDRSGKLVYHSMQAPVFSRLPAGFSTVERGEYHWRTFGLEQRDRYIQVAQPISVREDLALQLALHTLWPLGVLVPVTIVLVLLVVAKGLAPIGGLTRALSTRSIDSLEPLRLDGAVPVEIKPLVEALNDLLQRLNIASQAQRTFIADAAHELRSPLAALKLQLQAASRDGSLKGEGQALERVEGRVNRIIHLVQQLLTLAREDAHPVTSMVPVSLRRIGEQAVGDLSLLAETKEIDLGLECEDARADYDAYTVLAEPHGMSVLLGNLLNNAIRHTSRGGRVDVILKRSGERVGFDVVDSGSGIPEAEIERVFDRFYRGEEARGEGSGLGLAIVSRIAARHQLALSLRNNAGRGGLCVSVFGLAACQVDGSVSGKG